MNFKVSLFFLFVIAFFILLSCNKQEEGTLPEIQEISEDSSWQNLSLREKIGQVMCLSYNREQLDSIGGHNRADFFKQYPVGSFFMANWSLITYADPEHLAEEYRKSVLNLSSASPFPLLFSEDFETGAGSAVPQLTSLTTAMGLGATDSAEQAKLYGKILSREARNLGINWILNPVVDLNIHPFSFLTNVRSMSSDPLRVQKLSTQQIMAMQDNGVAATAKHFPGDGSDPVNQHFSTSQVKLSLGEWNNTFGSVFQNAIDSGVMCIMPGHITFPSYQKEQLNNEYLPATLSKELLTDLLKKKMGFSGVIVSDALNMAGIANFYENGLETEIECFKAGADILLWPSLAFMDSLEVRIVRKEIPMERLNDAVNRVWNMKKKLGLFEKDYQVIESLNKQKIERHRKQSYAIAKNALTVLSNTNDILPLDPEKSKTLLIIVTAQTDQSVYLEPFKKALEEKGFEVDMRHNLSFFTERSSFEKLNEVYDKFLFAFYAYPHAPWGSSLLSDAAALTMWSGNTLAQEKVISIGFGDPYKNMIYMPRVWARINTYAADPITQQAVADLLTGEFPSTGTSPVTYE